VRGPSLFSSRGKQRGGGLTDKIIPLFKNYPIYGEKCKDYADFYKVLEMIKTKKHLTKEGLEQIRFIKAGMNTGRSYMPT
jgi:hypothetical protein